jgi:hypothetical protein
MTRFRLSCVVFFLAFWTVSLNSQEKKSCDYVVKDVVFENPTGLSVEQLARLRTSVAGRCYDPSNAGSFSQFLYDQLRVWGYSKATVYDPNNFRILYPSLHPTPIAVTMDFRLVGSDASQK